MDGYLKRPHDNEKEERGDEKSTTRNDKWETVALQRFPSTLFSIKAHY